MTASLAIRLVLLSTLAIAAAYGSAFLPGGAPSWAPWAMVLGSTTVMVSLMVLGVVRRGQGLGTLLLPMLLVAGLVVGAFAAALLLGPEAPGGPMLLGLPRRAAIVLYGVGLLPMFILPIAYALTFDRMTLSDADLERVRREAAEVQARHGIARGGGHR